MKSLTHINQIGVMRHAFTLLTSYISVPAALHELWNRDEAPTSDEEQDLIARFGMEII